METVHQVHIERARWSKKHFRAGCPPARGMTSKIVRTEISFRFRNNECDVSPIDASHEYPSHQIARNHIGGPVEKSRSKNGVSFLQPVPAARPLTFPPCCSASPPPPTQETMGARGVTG